MTTVFSFAIRKIFVKMTTSTLAECGRLICNYKTKQAIRKIETLLLFLKIKQIVKEVCIAKDTR